MAHAKIQPVILCGGAGTRLWPLSRHMFPKQLHALTGERSLLQETALRVADADRFTAPIVVCNEAHRFAVGAQLAEVGVTPARIILEPQPKNTAPALTAAALISIEQEGPLFALPSDHFIAGDAEFFEAVDKAAEVARGGVDHVAALARQTVDLFALGRGHQRTPGQRAGYGRRRYARQAGDVGHFCGHFPAFLVHVQYNVGPGPIIRARGASHP